MSDNENPLRKHSVCVPITSLYDTNLRTEDCLYLSFDTLMWLLEQKKSIFQEMVTFTPANL